MLQTLEGFISLALLFKNGELIFNFIAAVMIH